jgi:aryl-alcohol dehydrogenase-like predicted oxidoreductase
MGLGGMPMSLATRPPEEQSLRTIHAAFDAGVDFVDTADVYCIDDHDLGHNERLIAKALRARSDAHRIVVATKGGLERPKGAWTTNGRPEHLRRACERSLRALGVDTIDVYQLHAPDDRVPYADTIGALAALRQAGLVRHVGLSNVSVAQIEIARRLVPVVSVQNRCNVHDRRAWREGVLRYCERNDIAFLPWSPVGGGRDRDKIARDPALNAVGRRHGASPYRVALAWLLAKSPVMIPIPGASQPQHAIDSAAAPTLALSAADLAELDAAFPTS